MTGVNEMGSRHCRCRARQADGGRGQQGVSCRWLAGPCWCIRWRRSQQCDWLEAIVVVAAADEMERAEQLVRKDTGRALRCACRRGRRRAAGQRSWRGLRRCNSDGALVHDAARPLVTPALIEACREAAERVRSGALAVPVKDTIKVTRRRHDRIDAGAVQAVAVQTPQAFAPQGAVGCASGGARSGHCRHGRRHAAGAAGHAGGRVPGHYANLKMTTPEDLL